MKKKVDLHSSEQNMPQIISKGIKLVSKVSMEIDSTFFFRMTMNKEERKTSKLRYARSLIDDILGIILTDTA